MKPLCSLVFFLILFSLNSLSATVYTTTGDGNINAASIWSPSKPSSPLANGDEIIINHAVTLNIDFLVYGKMTISSGASITGTNKKLKIGEGSTTGELINNGTINVKELKVKGDDTVQNLTAPSITNNGSITTGKLHVGDNSAAGILTNNIGADITVNGELHLDNILNNLGDMTVTGKLKVHGGTIKGGGEITNSQVELEENNGRPGTLEDQNICSDFGAGTEPTFEIKDGTVHSSLSAFIGSESSSSSDHDIDADNFYSCGFNSSGSPLPVELISFSLNKSNDEKVLLTWSTKTEIKSSHFEIERSSDGNNFEIIGQVTAAGSSDIILDYSYSDQSPLPVGYYRLKMVDLDGQFEFTETLVIETDLLHESKLRIYPTIAQSNINIIVKTNNDSRFRLRIYNLYGVKVYETSFTAFEHQFSAQIDISTLSNGYYNLALYNESRLITASPFIVETLK